MIAVEIKEWKYPRKATEYVTVLREGATQLTCVCPATPYRAQAVMAQRAFETLLATPEGEAFVRSQIAGMP